MEVAEGRILGKKVPKKESEIPGNPDVSLKSKRKRGARRRTAGYLAKNGTAELKQASFSSRFTISDESKDNQPKPYKKFDIVWIKYKTDEYRPCLITSVYKKYVNFKYINQSRKSPIYRARFNKIIRFDDPDQNYKLLNQGRKKFPAIVHAYNRVKHFLCRLLEQRDLSPMKYLFFDKTEDLLYGIIPECETQPEETLKDKDNDVELVYLE